MVGIGSTEFKLWQLKDALFDDFHTCTVINIFISCDRTEGVEVCSDRTEGVEVCSDRTEGVEVCSDRTEGVEVAL